MSESFAQLHPALQHHIVNSLGWRQLRALQEAAIAPLLAGEHALLLAPTAGGKTEAAFFPVLSRMLQEEWSGLSVLYVCPIKALLNNLHVRLRQYCGWAGRSVELWHGDVADTEKQAIRRDPPDVLLTTPESIEVLLTSKRSDPHVIFGNVRAVIVDELHAFAGDDRGWHLLAVMARVARIAGRPLQRIGLSATIGNPDGLLEWLAGHGGGKRRVIAPPAAGGQVPENRLDHVGTLENAATVISRLHRGEKRLVFLDSRARVEQLASSLRAKGVQTFVSHSSVSLDERRRAETAFAEGSDCVIVATSTLELGIDVGDLDRVIQVDAPGTVASLLQRLGRTGRRPGTSRNCLFLTTSDDAFLRAAGLLDLWASGYVEPVEPPVLPYHLLAQQLMALALQTGGITRDDWQTWIGDVPCFAEMRQDAPRILEHMFGTGILHEDQGKIWFGPSGEKQFGYRNFMELFSVFTSPPLFTVLHGRTELGLVHESTFLSDKSAGDAILLLAGRSWEVSSIDWSHRRAYVAPAPAGGRSRWCGGSRSLHFEHARAIRRVLATGKLAGTPSHRAQAELEELRDELSWVDELGTVIVHGKDGECRWWTFAGLRANTMLAEALGDLVAAPQVRDNLALPLVRGTDAGQLRKRLSEVAATTGTGESSERAIQGLKFHQCLPEEMAAKLMRARASDERAWRAVVSEPLRAIVLR
ncbi:MAG: DEAD/DEAH box helicase [Planctomycetota bacterium]